MCWTEINCTWKNCFKQDGLGKKYVAMGYATFLQFYIHNKIEKTFRPVKLAKFLCHKVIDEIGSSSKTRALKKWIDVNLVCESEEFIWWFPISLLHMHNSWHCETLSNYHTTTVNFGVSRNFLCVMIFVLGDVW